MILAAKIVADVLPGIDWMPLWVAGREVIRDPAALYDFDRITGLQPEIYRDPNFRPFVYPPSALLLITPLAQLPFWASLVLLSASSLTCLVLAARKAGSDPILVAIAAPVLISAVVGQMSLVVTALAMVSCLMLGKKNGTAGVLLGIAALIKPTLFVLAPIGLIASRNWAAIAFSALTFLAGVALSILLFGVQQWNDWFAAMPRFHQAFADHQALVRNAISPYSLAVRLDIEHFAIIAVFAIPAILLTWLAFSQRSKPPVLLAVMLGGALLISPYAMNYELAVFAPFILALNRDSLRSLLLCVVWAASLFFNAGVIGLLVSYAAVATPVITKWRQEREGAANISA